MLYFDSITCYLNWGDEGIGTKYNMNYMKVLEWIREKYYIFFQIVLTEKSLVKVEWDLERVSSLIQMINNYCVENKHDLTW
jgi:hypothetical protein